MSPAPQGRPPAELRKHRIFLVEDHPVTREGFAHLINFEGDLEVCGQAGTAAEALQGIPKARPDLVIVDISLAGTSGIELIKNLLSRHPALPILALSAHDESLYAERALRAGARGYIMKHESTHDIMTAIRRVLRGGIHVSERMQGRLLGRMATDRPGAPPPGVEQLSDRELEVFRLIGEGRSTRKIAVQLHLTISTVGTYRAKIKEKLGLTDPTELVQRAVAWVQAEGPREKS